LSPTLTSTFPFDITLRGGLRIGTIRNLSASSARDTLIVGPGPQGGPEVRLLNAQTGAGVIPPFFGAIPTTAAASLSASRQDEQKWTFTYM